MGSSFFGPRSDGRVLRGSSPAASQRGLRPARPRVTPPEAAAVLSERASEALRPSAAAASCPAWIAPSLLSADFARLGEEVEAIVGAGADLIHFDVMDNHFVPNLTFGPMVCEALAAAAGPVPIDVHLMARPVDRLIHEFADAGAAWISIHPEGTDNLDRSLALIRDLGCRAGLVLSPATPLAWLDWTLDRLDLVLVMSVNPGFGGQSFIPERSRSSGPSARSWPATKGRVGSRSGWRSTAA